MKTRAASEALNVRKIVAQGNALGLATANDASPERATEKHRRTTGMNSDLFLRPYRARCNSLEDTQGVALSYDLTSRWDFASKERMS